jgi:hypothetical protein
MTVYAIAIDGTQICGYGHGRATPPWLWLLRASVIHERLAGEHGFTSRTCNNRSL